MVHKLVLSALLVTGAGIFNDSCSTTEKSADLDAGMEREDMERDDSDALYNRDRGVENDEAFLDAGRDLAPDRSDEEMAFFDMADENSCNDFEGNEVGESFEEPYRDDGLEKFCETSEWERSEDHDGENGEYSEDHDGENGEYEETSEGELVKEIYTWDPLIRHVCYSVYADPPQWLGPPQGPDCEGANPRRWMFASTNEDSAFSGGGMHDLSLDDPSWSFAFNDTGMGTYQVGWVLDKVNNPQYLDRYTFLGFVDSWDVNGPPYPGLGKDIFVDLDLSLMAAENIDSQDPEIGRAKSRILVGAAAFWNGRTHYLEVNLWRTDEFDLCTSDACIGGNCCPPAPCDTIGVFDRRADCDASQGWPAAVYFHGPSLDLIGIDPLPRLQEDAGLQHYHVPIGKLYHIAPWSDPPSSWEGIHLAGVYIGVEIWGRGRVWIEFRNYECYSIAQ